MKKLFTLVGALLLLAAGTVSTQAQIANPKFENWTDTDPDSWNALLNGLIPLVGDTSVVKTTGNTGFAAKLKPVDISLLGLPVYASLLNGDFPISTKYSTLSFYFKSVINDPAIAVAQVSADFTRWNPAADTADIIGTATYSITASQGSFMLVNAPFDFSGPNASLTPDSIKISCIIISDMTGAQLGDHLTVDDFMVSGTVSAPVVTKLDVNVFPTVTKDVVNFNFKNAAARIVEVTSINGAVVKSFQLNDTKNVTDLSDLTSGIYIYTVKDLSDNTSSSGRVVVAK